MTGKLLYAKFKKILVVGNMLGKIEILDKIKKISNKYDHIILNGGMPYNIQEIESLNKKMIYILDNNDLIRLTSNDDVINQWLQLQFNIIVMHFSTRHVIITNGGIPNSIKCKEDLINNIETSFVSNIDGKSWHEQYRGGLGYVISNGPLKITKPNFFNYSMQLGVMNDVYGQEIEELGLKQTILF